jgi:hypothetical protein
MLSNEIKKGFKLVANGFSGTMVDNLKGNTRMVEVDGICGQEIGSVYVWNISRVENPVTGEWEKVELTEKQIKTRSLVRSMGF